MYIVYGEPKTPVSKSTSSESTRLPRHIQVCTHCLFCSKVVNECSCHTQAAFLARSATAACAIGLDRVEVFSERRVLEMEDPSCGDSIPEPLKKINCYRCELIHLFQYVELTAVLVGQTQSNMSAPRAIATRRSSG
jgi:hypothetical protein